MNILKKIYQTIKSSAAERGLYYTFIMNITHLIGIIRGGFYKILYFKNINSSIFSLQRGSSIEIFNKKSKVNIGKFVFIRKNTSIRVDDDSELTIGDKVFINDNCNINCAKKIFIGEGTKIAPNVSINDHDHNYKKLTSEHLLKGEVIIGSNVWIGSNTVVLRGSTIGDNSVIAAGSIVNGDIPANSLYRNKLEKITKEYVS